jgi:hypothetical protein
MDYLEADYPCVGVCMVDADGYCVGCGRPPLPVSNLTPPASSGATSRAGEAASTDDDPAASSNVAGSTAGVPSSSSTLAVGSSKT